METLELKNGEKIKALNGALTETDIKDNWCWCQVKLGKKGRSCARQRMQRSVC